MGKPQKKDAADATNEQIPSVSQDSHRVGSSRELTFPLGFAILSANESRSMHLTDELLACLEGRSSEYLRKSESIESCDVLFIDSSLEHWHAQLKAQQDFKGYRVLVVAEKCEWPEAYDEGWVDEVLVRPIRGIELVLRFERMLEKRKWLEIAAANQVLKSLVDEFKNDLQISERLQKGVLPLRFPDVKGFKIASRYIAGAKSGGDYFDIAEGKAGSQFSLLLTDSSSYGLSSAVVSTLMKIAMHLSSDESRSCTETVRKIRSELISVLGTKNSLSLFYGVMSRKDYLFKYLNLGSTAVFHLPKATAEIRYLKPQGEAMTESPKFHQSVALGEGLIQLQPGDRLVLFSDGFVDQVGSGDPLECVSFLEKYKVQAPVDLLNECAYQIKKSVGDDDLPPQDCTGIVLDVDSRLIRLA